MKMTNGSKSTGMATVEIDHEALERLQDARTEGETVSDVIRRCVRPRQSASEILRMMRRAAVSPKTLLSIEKSANRRRQRAHQSKD
jgi:predicted CopG family antitoxin